MQRLATWLATWFGTSIALVAIAPTAQAGSYTFSIGGHRVHVEAPRNCRSASCVTVSSNRSLRPTADAGPAAPTPVVQAPQPACPEAPARPPQAIIAVQPSVPPVLAAATSQPAVPPPPSLETSGMETSKRETAFPGLTLVDPPRLDQPKTVALDPPAIDPSPEIKQAATGAQPGDDESYTPLGEWESAGAKGTVRIERCGPALCGYALTDASRRGESVLVNMKPKKHDVWTGSIYSRSSGNTYHARMTLKRSGRLHVEACALGRFWCSGNDWTRVEARREQLITTSPEWSARS